MKKHNQDGAGAWLLKLDPAKFVEPRENPLDFPPVLTCGPERWCRYRVLHSDGGAVAATYTYYRYALPIIVHRADCDFGWTHGEGIWVLCGCCSKPMHATACQTFGEARAFVRSYQKADKWGTFMHAYPKGGQ